MARMLGGQMVSDEDYIRFTAPPAIESDLPPEEGVGEELTRGQRGAATRATNRASRAAAEAAIADATGAAVTVGAAKNDEPVVGESIQSESEEGEDATQGDAT